MTEATVTISDDKFSSRALTNSTRRAWADYVKRRWPTNTVKQVQDEWDLTDGEARGIVYGTASQRTLDRIDSHKNGGVMLALDLLCVRFRTSLEDVAAKLEEQNAHERNREAARIQRRGHALRALAGVCRRLPEDQP